ncbi:unnamed protein product [Symbiodinium pilosum]|uniref:Uncharacterized protein n=1 Tax=Symbiodinium pilosum TaxID=2952 RepID=A0A812XIL2_SYMPI|nr:unnamed protein product [Symbiodinium pilosum]
MSRYCCCCFARWTDSDSSSSSEEIISDDEADYLYFPPKTYEKTAPRSERGTTGDVANGEVRLPPPIISASKSLKTLDASPVVTFQLLGPARKKPGAAPGAEK